MEYACRKELTLANLLYPKKYPEEKLSMHQMKKLTRLTSSWHRRRGSIKHQSAHDDNIYEIMTCIGSDHDPVMTTVKLKLGMKRKTITLITKRYLNILQNFRYYSGVSIYNWRHL